MLALLPGPLLAIIAFLLYVGFSVLLAIIFFMVMLLWLITPIPAWRQQITNRLFKIPSLWSETLRWVICLTTRTQWHVTGTEPLSKKQSYLLIANHQGFLDILVLQKVLDRLVPQLRYFMKKELLWVPIIGQACWIMGYPFMQRHSKTYLKKHPRQRNKDLDTTRKTCERFRGKPVTLINYVEGTRVTAEKQQQQRSPYKHLLKPKASGIAQVVASMAEQIDTILNVTIIYSQPKHISWTFLQGKMKHIIVHIEIIKIPADLRGDYQNNRAFRIHFQAWLNRLWEKKEQLISKNISRVDPTEDNNLQQLQSK